MSIAKRFLGVVIGLLAASLALSQTNAAPSVKAGAEILSDTMGVDFGPYIKDVYKTVRQRWYELLPPSIYPPALKQGKVAVRFTILENGKVRGIRVDQSAGAIALDRAALGAIAPRFAPLPPQFPGQEIELRMRFYYNVDPPQFGH